MEHLPPVGWADVATNHDLHELEERLNLRMETLESRINSKLAEREAHLLRTMILANSASVLTVAGLAFAAAKVI